MDEVLARAGIFHGVAPGAIAAVANRLKPVEFPRGHQVFAEGDVGDQLYIIVAGRVKVGRRTVDGRENLLALMGPADMFGELALFDPGPRTSTVTALTDVRAVTMDGAALHMWIRQYPEVAEQLLRVLARRLRRTNDSVTAMIFTDVAGRVAKQLLMLAHRFGVPDPLNTPRISFLPFWRRGLSRCEPDQSFAPHPVATPASNRHGMAAIRPVS